MKIMNFREMMIRIVWPLSILRFQLKRRKMNLPVVMDAQETITNISEKHCSLARFGDGELMWMSGLNPNAAFQAESNELSNDLSSVLKTRSSSLLIGMPDQIGGVFNGGFSNRAWWSHWMNSKYPIISKQFPEDYFKRNYGNTNATRFYDCYRDKDVSKYIASLWKEAWKNRNVIIVEGEYTRFGVGNDFLEGSKSIRRIECPPVNAYGKIQTILANCVEVAKKVEDPLVLAALGPAATILVKMLDTEFGIQAIDIGHADVEYEWLLRGESNIAIRGKYVNEVSNGHNITELKNQVLPGFDDYKSQIVSTINP